MAHQQIKNLLFVLPGLDTGGSEHVVLNIAKGLDRNRYRPVVFSILSGYFELQFKNAGIETIISYKREGKDHFKLMVDLYKVIRKYQIDIVLPHHFVSLFYSFWGTKLKSGTKLFFTEHSALGIDTLPFSHRLLSIIFLSLSAGCIAVSSQISNSYKTSLKVSPSKIFLIPNGIELGKFDCYIDNENVKKALGILPGNRIIGAVANIRKVKNHRNLLLAFHKVQNRMKNVLLVLVGSGPLENEMKALSNDLQISDKILFLGQRSDVAELYKIFDIFCLPSFSEGLPLSILEAMASKLPLVATNVSGNNEIIQSGENGLLVPSNDPEKLAEALILLLQDRKLRLRLGKKAYETVCRNYSLGKWISKYERLFSM